MERGGVLICLWESTGGGDSRGDCEREAAEARQVANKAIAWVQGLAVLSGSSADADWGADE